MVLLPRSTNISTIHMTGCYQSRHKKKETDPNHMAKAAAEAASTTRSIRRAPSSSKVKTCIRVILHRLKKSIQIVVNEWPHKKTKSSKPSLQASSDCEGKRGWKILGFLENDWMEL